MKKIAAGLALSALAATGAEAEQVERNRVAPAAVYDVAPGLGHFTDDVLFGEVWLRKELAPRDRTHPLGQTLFIVSGRGWAQTEGGPREEVGPGDVVWIPPNVRHWHGATPDGPMRHFAVAEALNGSAVTWMELVPDETYWAGMQRMRGAPK